VSTKATALYAKVCDLLTTETTGEVISALLGVIYTGARTRNDLESIHGIVLQAAEWARQGMKPTLKENTDETLS
jgi:hypothetical protein